jgi:hypothetical protein
VDARDLPRSFGKTHGGKRPGAGRKAQRGRTTRAVALLDASEVRKLFVLMQARGESASDVLRAGLAALAVPACE